MEEKPLDPPSPASDYQSPPPPKSSSGAGWIIALVLGGVLLLTSCACVPLLIALLLPAVQSAREAARTAQSSNNMKMITLAMHNYHTVHGTFPPAYLPDESGQPMTSWRTLLLPFMEQVNLYDMVDTTRPWDDPVNSTVRETSIMLYHSPRDPDPNSIYTNYVAITGEGTAMPGSSATDMGDIRDGMSNTILLIEIVNSDIEWSEPRDLDINNLSRVDEGADPSAVNVIPRRAVVGFCDGSVRNLPAEVSGEVLRKYLLRDDGEALPGW